MYIVGFTGTQEGMTDHQILEVGGHFLKISIYNSDIELHHGDCIGADSDAHDIARFIKKYWIVAHPPTDPIKRAFKDADVILEPKKYMVRNKEIAKVCSILIATPKEKHEILRSGTWSTIRRARRLNKEVIIIPPQKD